MGDRDLADWWTRHPVRLLASLVLVAALMFAVDGFCDQERPSFGFFVNDDGRISADSSGKVVLEDWRIELAKKAKESRPAHLDPEGNWGEPSSGMQMSIRLDKSSYKVGESVNATIIVRNLDQKPREYMVLLPLDLGFGLSLFVSGKPVPVPTKSEAREPNAFGKRLSRLIMGGRSFGLSPKEQRKHEMCLDWFYDLIQPGSYQIMASREIDDPETGGKSLISTTFATFEIVSGGGQDSRTNIQPGSVVSPPILSPAGSGEPRAIPATSFQQMMGVTSPVSGSSAMPPSSAVPPLADTSTARTTTAKGWTWGLLFVAMAAFIGSILWVLRRRSGRS